MTIKEMRREMRARVVPEEVVPQNVINRLIDEEAEPPKLDAFAFLMRLRALGIGSSDFVNLLEGCGAPENAVERIRQNPAMNLQGLVLTLESSGLDTDDYTRMLLTARQVWERTLTLRLERSQVLAQVIEQSEYDDNADNLDVSQDTEEPNEEFDEAVEEETDGEYDLDYDEDMREMSFTAVLERINEDMRSGGSSEPEKAPENDVGEVIEEDKAPEPPEEDRENGTDGETEDSGEELTFTAAFDKIKSEKHVVEDKEPTGAAASDTTMLIKIDRDMLMAKFGGVSEEQDEETVEPDDTVPEKPAVKRVKTAVQKRTDRYEAEDIEDDEDDEDKDYEPETDRGENSGYHREAIIAAAFGAAALIGASIFVGATVKGRNEKLAHYADGTSEIFNKIYYAYGGETPGGGTASGINEDPAVIFGDLLISGGGNASIGSFTVGASRYSVTEKAISASVVQNGTTVPLADLTPPDSARFVAAFDDNGKLYALFSGKQSGYMKIADGKAEYTVRQDGYLTDYEVSGGAVSLGTVYTPAFGRTFRITDEAVYLPKTGTIPAPISAENVIVSDTEGYSYGVSAQYSTAGGEITKACAVLGDPMAASADGRFVMNGESGLIVKTGSGKKLQTEQIKNVTRAAFYKDGVAIAAEDSNNEDESNSGGTAQPETITLYNADMKPLCILSGVPEKIGGLWFDGGLLTIKGVSGSTVRVNCTNPSAPKPITSPPKTGAVIGKTAITFEIAGSEIALSRYDAENGAAKKSAEYRKALSAEQLATAKFGDPRAALTDNAVSGAAYSYFDGVSTVSEYAVFANGQAPKTAVLYDDRTGFTSARLEGGEIIAVCADGDKVPQ